MAGKGSSYSTAQNKGKQAIKSYFRLYVYARERERKRDGFVYIVQAFERT